MAQKTIKNQGNTLSGSIGAGFGSIFNPGGRKYYILEHKVSSKYHRQGEAQEIIVDTIELGRDSHCQVRFDDNFPTVSRRHASIVRDGDNWKLVQLSHTNTTLLNGRPVQTEWYLQNGDEIQLSINGPKLGFIIPTGNKATVGSIGLTRRLSLFRQQAMRPYKNAIAALCAALIVICGVGGYFLHKQGKELLANGETITRLIAEAAKNDSLNVVKDSIYQAKMDSIARLKKTVVVRSGGLQPDTAISKLLANVKPYVYFVKTTAYIEFNGKTERISSSQGTGFLLDDGRFVTARHCVQPWLYRIDLINAVVTTAKIKGRSDVNAYAVIEAQSMNDRIHLRSTDFTVDDSYDKVFQTTVEDEDAWVTTPYPISFKDGTQLGEERMQGNDWAYARVNKSGGIKPNVAISSSLKAGTTVHVLGFPSGLGKSDGNIEVEPIYNKMSVSRDGLNNGRCIMVTEGVAHGNSGGPIFVVNNGRLEAVAVVSRKESATQQYGMFGITQQQQQYDHLVPLSNMK